MNSLLKEQLETYSQLYWWNFGKKTLSFKGNLKDLLKKQNITYTTRKSNHEGVYTYYFKSKYNVTFKVKGTVEDFPLYAKQFIQMELVRMGDKSQLYVNCGWRPFVTVNF